MGKRSELNKQLEELLRTDSSIKKFKKKFKLIPYAYKNKKILYKKKLVYEVEIDFSKNVDWLNELDTKFCINIGETFYTKSPHQFKYDYFNQSFDFAQNLDKFVETGKINIIVNCDDLEHLN